MGKIIILDENTANKIAAGEVIEKPASVIKELVENSIDAGATGVNVEIRNGGISFIRVIDNGSGMAEDDVEIAFERHATSKIRRADDLESIASMGFRGEALASIAAVSAVQLTTRVKSAVQGVAIDIKGGCVLDVKPAGCPVGTSITVRELFFNTPARYKFLKKDSTEAGYIADMLSRIALGYPDVSFKLVSNGSVILHTPGNGDLKSAIFSIYGAETARQLIEVSYDDSRVKISGYIGKAELSRSNRNQQSIYINRRYIRSKTISAALDEAYSTFLMKNRHAFALLDIRLNPALVDVNVHPSKMEVKFSSEQDIYRAVYHAVNSALLSGSSVRTLPSGGKSAESAFRLVERKAEKPVFTQQEFEWVRKELEQKRADAISGRTTPERNEAAPIEQNASEPRTREAADPIEQNASEPQAREAADPNIQDAVFTASQVTAAPMVPNAADPAGHTASERIAEAPMLYSQAKEDRHPDPAAEGNDTGADITWKPEDSEKLTTEGMHRRNLFDGARLIGQAFSTYILLERGDELFLLDQHAAHERIRYEELKSAYSKSEPISQTLLAVLPVELTGGEYRFAMEEAPFFEQLGFTYESFGQNAILLRSVPFEESGQDCSKIFLEILDFVMSGESGHKSQLADETLYRLACKSAVKAHKKLNEREIEALLDRLASLENPYTCPHGRPAILKLRKYDLEKLFKRIV